LLVIAVAGCWHNGGESELPQRDDSARLRELGLTRHIPSQVYEACAEARRNASVRVFCPRLVPDVPLLRIEGNWGAAVGSEESRYYLLSFDTAPGYYKPPQEGVIHWIVGGGQPGVVKKWVLTDFANEVSGDPELVRTAQTGGRQILVYRFPPFPAGGINGGHQAAVVSVGDELLFVSFHGSRYLEAAIEMALDLADQADPGDSPAVTCGETADLVEVAVPRSPSGDPTADCAAAWQGAFDAPAPELTAFTAGDGGILVVPANGPAPSGSTGLAKPFELDHPLIQLEHELAEVGRGVVSRCRSLTTATALVRKHLDRLGLGGWTVASEGDRPDSARTCAMPTIDAHQRRVVILGFDEATLPADPPAADLSRALAHAMIAGPAARCLSAAEAAALVEREVAARRLRERAAKSGYQIVVSHGFPASRAPDGRRTCVRPAVNAGGTVLVYLAAVPAEQPTAPD